MWKKDWKLVSLGIFYEKCYVRQNNIHSVLESFLKSLKQKNGWKQIIFDI